MTPEPAKKWRAFYAAALGWLFDGYESYVLILVAAVAVREKLAADFPAVQGHRYQLARGQQNLALVLLELGKPADAEAVCRAAQAVLTKLVAEAPAAPYRATLANGHNILGALLVELGRHQEAAAEYSEALRVRRQLADETPLDPAHLGMMAAIGNNLAGVQIDLGQPAQKIAVGHDQPRIGIRHDMRQQAAAIGKIDRYIDRTEIVEAEPDSNRIRSVGQPRQHLVALRNAKCGQSNRCATRDRLRLAIGPFGAIGETREHLVGRCGGVTIEQRPQHAQIG